MTSRHAGSESRHIARRIVIEGDLVLQTPAHFGGGESDGTTVLLLEDPLSGSPLLPGASLYDRNRGAQSRVIVDDALGSGAGHLLEGRDGVKINADTIGRPKRADSIRSTRLDGRHPLSPALGIVSTSMSPNNGDRGRATASLARWRQL
ncbi:MAG: hypothetical protein IPK19_25070 [Chloroflexi bacterium]|nr:hypothetical protein [Chloroflexota bacterium]